MGNFGNSKMASITKITNRLHFAKRMFSSSSARMSGDPYHLHSGPADCALWKKATFFGALPAILFGHYMAFRPYFAPYDYLRVRSKKFPWGDGNHSLFHNDHSNALPDVASRNLSTQFFKQSCDFPSNLVEGF